MYKGQKILVVVPARGGSKGVPHKNIHPLLGEPLIAHVGRIVRALPETDRAVVSTDDDAIAAAAQSAGLGAPFRRPMELAGDLIGDFDILKHALLEMERVDNTRYAVILMLQPTSPLRRPEHVSACLRKLVDGNWDAVWTVSPTDLKYHPKKQLRLTEDSLGYDHPDGAHVIARQQLEPLYHRNGAAYAFTRQCLLEQNAILGRRTSAIVIQEPMISIDTLEDFSRVEALLSAQRVIAS